FGEYSANVAMRYAKELGRNPFELAEELAAFLREQGIAELADAQAVKPGFLNLYLTPAAKTQHLTTITEAGAAYGKNTSHAGETWVIEHTSPNPNKAMHIGHLRLNLVGMGIVRLLQAAGAEVIADAVYNDRGIAIAKAMYGFLAHQKKDQATPTDIAYWVAHQDEWLTPVEKDMKPDRFVTECYVLAEKDVKEDPAVEQRIRQMVVDWEAGDTDNWQLWRQVLQYAYIGNEHVLGRLGSHWDKVWYEHEHYQKGKEYVEKGLREGIFQKLEDGAVLTDLEDPYGLSDTVLLKNDGTSLYITQDIALTDLKKTTYNADHLVWVIGPDQTLALKQLFAVCEQLGIGKLSDFTHVSYGYVGLKEDDGSFKKMSSREGTALFLEDVIDAVKAVVRQRFDAEEKHDTATREALAETLALAAVKFAFLKSDRAQDIAFDIEQSVDVQGDSGMYVEYTFVRTQSILKKAGRAAAGPTGSPAKLGPEAEL
ncbi:arginine--tRNA ligase, partial [Candidatus Kaiserbacteria bacterium]|nr:arginine--tRNA ligase [Candidatus Kaiserbacteria bacterium]